MSTLDKIQAAGKAGQLLPSSVEIISTWLAAGLPTWADESTDELVAKGAWSELNDRFYRYLEFGTGGMRGRTIGVISTAAEQGVLGPQGTPEHAGIGSNVLNDYPLVRATIGLTSPSSSPRTTSATSPATSASCPPPRGRASAASPTSSTARAPRRSSASACAT